MIRTAASAHQPNAPDRITTSTICSHFQPGGSLKAVFLSCTGKSLDRGSLSALATSSAGSVGPMERCHGHDRVQNPRAVRSPQRRSSVNGSTLAAGPGRDRPGCLPEYDAASDIALGARNRNRDERRRDELEQNNQPEAMRQGRAAADAADSRGHHRQDTWRPTRSRAGCVRTIP